MNTKRIQIEGMFDRSSANVEIVRRAYDHAAEGDFIRFFDDFAEDAVGYDAEGLPYGGVFPGKAGVQELCAKMFSAWEHVDWTIREVAAGGDIVLVHLLLEFTPRGGEKIEHPAIELWRISGGRVIELRPFYYDTKLIADLLLDHA